MYIIQTKNLLKLGTDLDILPKLRASHNSKNKNYQYMGINLKTSEPSNMIELGVIDCFKAKYHAINAATDVSKLILKIDDVIDQADKSAYAPPPKPREDIEDDL